MILNLSVGDEARRCVGGCASCGARPQATRPYHCSAYSGSGPRLPWCSRHGRGEPDA
ncbi:hypothetical protein N177_3372 [Lutibaculum baratangense AMV1]|uniref:Uncharacterized protein n=1 Tax=Lutibaculum baratangense AMV1 TaxID=631454 RepID=V4RD34_9HYPH|nr:hypothetical protein N177_3372 [Lutibaculum baratangense AMV1]